MFLYNFLYLGGFLKRSDHVYTFITNSGKGHKIIGPLKTTNLVKTYS
ncbi:hypothetical protein M153_220009334 [Pseudoloma neurophilia]|uniref:Uncharacterized protein n=1 Tax=Pseudoloma neurophilia TaxID=146866 RepID=A0A0R0M0Q3_9MICR|nr:hypothetical protein M153_220009334 [Pseudoloma neurophilia]